MSVPVPGAVSVTRDRWTNTDGCFRRMVRSGNAMSPNQLMRHGVGPLGKTAIRGDSLRLLSVLEASPEGDESNCLTNC